MDADGERRLEMREGQRDAVNTKAEGEERELVEIDGDFTRKGAALV